MDRREAIKRTAFILGGSLSASVVAGVLNGCQATAQRDWTPKVLSKEQAAMIGEMTECILPATNTPGAKDLFVDEFIDLMLADCFEEKERELFLISLGMIGSDCEKLHGKPFEKCSSEQQVALLQEAEKRAAEDTGEDKPFFRVLKELTLVGYFTSESVMTEQLKYAPVPGVWEGCIDIGPDEPVHVDNNV